MNEFEVLLKSAIEKRDKYNSVNLLLIEYKDRELIEKLKNGGLIEHVRYIGQNAVGFDITYDGLHYFDEKDKLY